MKYLARQPILNRSRELFAYELLFRNGLQNSCEGIDLELASTSVLDTSFLIGFEKITAGRRMFINCPRDFLLRDYASLFPPQSVVIEILETIRPDQEVIEACRRLKQAGYTLALDDFVDSPAWAPLVELADIIKIDFQLTDRNEQRDIVSRYAGKKIRMLAEKVETQEEFTAGMQMGYTLFQGYFFCRPEVMRHRALPASKLLYLDLLRAATAPEFNIRELAPKIKHEPSLTYRLLRYLNSAAFGLRAEIRSVAHALSLLGERELRKWIAVVSVSVLADGKPDELMTVPLVRGRFCELLAPLAGLADHASDLFLMGLLSVMDAVLDQPLDSILADLPVRQEIKEALLARAGLYWRLLEIAVAHERADWEKVSALLSETEMEEDRVSELYVAAVDWSTALRSNVPAPAGR
ncbi:MAG TPA: HDOD domain-containing protein [Verrucomicrobiae bacterium]|jgi:c-di-GMP-related signal transduction protein|nr:HDOD domain-containing protein [Verrucomicrobiae bacterium]